MVNVVITGHGGRGGGTATGTYVIPKGVTIYFFTKDGQLLNTDGSDVIMDTLCSNHPNELAAQGVAKEVKTAFSTIPNYICYGANDFRDPTGAYVVGQPPSAGPLMAIPNGTQKTLSEIVGGAGSGGVIGNRIYWLCCRALPQSTNNTDIQVATTLTDSNGAARILGGSVGSADTGLKPSQVKALRRWQ